MWHLLHYHLWVCHLLILGCSLSMIRSHYGLFLGLLALDISSHWIQMYRYVHIRVSIFLTITFCFDYKKDVNKVSLIKDCVFFFLFLSAVHSCRARQAIKTWVTARALCSVCTINIGISWDTAPSGRRYKAKNCLLILTLLLM